MSEPGVEDRVTEDTVIRGWRGDRERPRPGEERWVKGRAGREEVQRPCIPREHQGGDLDSKIFGPKATDEPCQHEDLVSPPPGGQFVVGHDNRVRQVKMEHGANGEPVEFVHLFRETGVKPDVGEQVFRFPDDASPEGVELSMGWVVGHDNTLAYRDLFGGGPRSGLVGTPHLI